MEIDRMDRNVIEGRRTGMGAETCAVVLRKPAEITEFNMSRRGNHWQEEIAIGEGGVVFVIDISNSQKHHCYLLGTSLSLEDAEKEFGELSCGLPARLHG